MSELGGSELNRVPLDDVIDQIGIDGAIQDIDGYFLHREMQYKERLLGGQYRDTLAEQEELRDRSLGLKKERYPFSGT